MISALIDLTWWFGSWKGDAGLRSSFGAQLARAREAASGPLEFTAIDSSHAEDAMIKRLGSAHSAGRIGRRFAQLDGFQQEVLRLHFTGGSLPFGVDVSAILLPAARRLVVADRFRSARHWLAEARVKKKTGTISDEVTQANRYRHEASFYRRSTSPIPPEVLRFVLHDAPEAEQVALRNEADQQVRDAMNAYETVHVPDFEERRIQVDDPRAWKRTR